MKCNCYICGKEFDRKPALIARAKNPVCSRECQTALKLKRYEVPCVICGKMILRSDKRLSIRPNPVCSETCRKALGHKLFWDESISDDERQKTRKVPERMPFIKSVMTRDGFKCVICNQNTHDLVVHHLNGYNWDVENRCNPNNGVTLCKSCHKAFHHAYGIGNNTKEQFIEYANQTGRLTGNTVVTGNA